MGDLVPTPETGRAFGILLTQAGETVAISAAPAPSNRGTILAISLLVGLTALAVDAIGVTYRSPALAGIPLLAAFLGSATNSGDGLAPWYVIPTALCWLALMGRQSVGSLRAWGTPAPREAGRPVTRAPPSRPLAASSASRPWPLPWWCRPSSPTCRRRSSPTASGRAATAVVGGSSIQLSSTVDIARDPEPVGQPGAALPLVLAGPATTSGGGAR